MPIIIGMEFSQMFRRARKHSKLSQLELANRAGVALATVQNIEMGRANPSLNTLKAICKILHIKIVLEFERSKTDPSVLAALGCPFMSEPNSMIPTRAKLIQEICDLDVDQLAERERKAIAAWLLAIHDHYPSVWMTLPRSISAWAQNQVPSPKLRRLALGRLSEFL